MIATSDVRLPVRAIAKIDKGMYNRLMACNKFPPKFLGVEKNSCKADGVLIGSPSIKSKAISTAFTPVAL